MMLLNILMVLLQMQQSATLGNAEDTHKFFVPVMVIAVIFIGIVVYLISIDRKLKKLEEKK
jgi:CcmD family protein